MSPQYRILLADDLDVATWTANLWEFDCETKVAATCDALDKVRDWRPDLVVLDSSGPGLDLCRKVKQNSGSSRTIVLMLAHLNGMNEIERAVDAGADDLVSMSVDKIEFLNRVENLLKISHL